MMSHKETKEWMNKYHDMHVEDHNKLNEIQQIIEQQNTRDTKTADWKQIQKEYDSPNGIKCHIWTALLNLNRRIDKNE